MSAIQSKSEVKRVGSILLVEDEQNMVRTLRRILERKGFKVGVAANGSVALEELGNVNYDLVITDLNMPVMDGIALLRSMVERGVNAGVIVLTGHGSITSAVEAMKLGAGDYLIKPCQPEELLVVVDRVLELRRLRSEVDQLRNKLAGFDRFGEITGNSEAMMEIYRVINAVSQNKSNVLISGENGTGKELIARTIHRRSPMKDAPFVAINCGALSETLLESQLFGHRKGAFTGAIDDHNGVFVAADGGTLFLDEVVEIPLPLQVKFLRAIQEKEVTPVGSTEPIQVDLRIVAATNRDLEEVVASGAFRSDLFYRLNVVPIHLPPLRERPEDIPLLIERFTEELSRAYSVQPKRLEEDVIECLLTYAWPGNIRELQNAIERTFALSSKPEISVDDLPAGIRQPQQETAPKLEGYDEEVVSLPQPLDLVEKLNIESALQSASGNKNKAAELLGIARQRLYRKLEKYGL